MDKKRKAPGIIGGFVVCVPGANRIPSGAAATRRWIVAAHRASGEVLCSGELMSRGEKASRIFQPVPTLSVGISPEGIPLGLERVVRTQTVKIVIKISPKS